MKIGLAVAVAVGLSVAPGAGRAETPPTAPEVGAVPVVRAEVRPEIDGAPGEAWSSAVERSLEHSSGPIPTSADLQGQFRVMWDDDALYVLVRVLDDHAVSGEGSAPWDDDGVEVYVDGDGSRNDAVEGYDGNDRQYVFRRDDPGVYEAKGGSVEGIRVAQGEWDYGYRVEVAIPWSTLEVAPKAGDTIGLDVHVNDDDGVGREDKLMWSAADDEAHSEPRRFGKAVLLEAARATEEQRSKLTVAAPDLGAELSGEPPLRLQYHDIRADAEGLILPWSHDDPALAYDHVVRLVWDFWRKMGDCPNGVKYYLQHQVWRPGHDPRGLGGDQISMALSSWNLLHQYLGDPAVVADMRLQADHWIENGFTGPHGPWPNVPFPYNTDIHSGRYDGDMIAGKGFVQPDKAGSFGTELVTLYKITDEGRYLEAAIGIADTLARNVKPGDEEDSPWPYRVHFETGEVFEREEVRFTYTTNWTGALRLFDDLIAMGKGRVADYQKARALLTDWLKTYPLKTMRWGPFFEDINTYSDTQINAGTLARYILEHPDWLENGPETVRRILDDCDRKFGNSFWAKYGVRATNEQTAYEVPGNSHGSRQNALELMWMEATDDWSGKEQAVRNLNWATYMVARDGRNRYYRDDVWLTDGYGDYVRHYLRSMAASPDLAPPGQNHLLRTSSVIRSIDYGDDAITYEKWDTGSHERLKLGAWEPGEVEGGTLAWNPDTRVLEVNASAKRIVIHRALGAGPRTSPASRVSVHEDGRYLMGEDRSPFFWLGDTAWELFHALDRDETELYLEDRAGKGFNVIQAVLLAEAGGYTTPNAYGDLPFSDYDRLELAVTPGADPDHSTEYDYWDHAEWIIRRAGERGLFVAALPCWGEYVTPRFREATFDTPDEAYAYGQFLGERFRQYSHVIWILGGDRLPDERVNGIHLWRAMAEGISDGTNGTPGRDGQSDYTTTLMSFHCYRSSSVWFHDDPWVDFHMWGSYHEKRDNERAWLVAESDWRLPDSKPTLNSEPAYEDIPINYDPALGLGYFDDFDVRQVAYWSVFSGCFGHTYGSNSVYRMWKKEPNATFRRLWEEALALPGSAQMVHLKKLMLSRPFFGRVPNQDVVAANVHDPVGMLRATSGRDYAMVYVPNGKPVTVRTGIVRGEELMGWWFNPRTGAATRIGTSPNTGVLEFDAPGETARGNDWVLVLDNADAGFPAPGLVER